MLQDISTLLKTILDWVKYIDHEIEKWVQIFTRQMEEGNLKMCTAADFNHSEQQPTTQQSLIEKEAE